MLEILAALSPYISLKKIFLHTLLNIIPNIQNKTNNQRIIKTLSILASTSKMQSPILINARKGKSDQFNSNSLLSSMCLNV